MAVDDSSSPSSSSSSSSVESSFRELDDVFLQSQARIWIEEVLHTRFDEQLNISDLLSDGELLFEVSKEIWNMLLLTYMELNNIKAHMFIPVDTRKSSGRYRPYSNVDSFLKVCKVLGLSGVDLFSPSDVVEKRDTRKVCICIRSLSKKARSNRLNVPDFDIVSKTIAMPTDVVRCIRRSLELSTCSQTKDTRFKFRQKSSFAAHRQKDESCVEESNEAKSKFSETSSYSSYSDTSYTDSLYLDSGESQITLTQGILQSNAQNKISSPVYGSQLIICDVFTPANHGVKVWHDNKEADQIDVSHGVGENAPSLQNKISLSEMICFRILTNHPFHISEDCFCHSCMGFESHNSNSSMCRTWRLFPEASSSTSSVNSVVSRVLDFDFDLDAKSEPDDLGTSISFTRDLQQHEARSQGKISVLRNEFLELQFETKLQHFESFSSCWDDSGSYASVDQDFESVNQISLLLVKDDIKNFADNSQETVASDKSIKNAAITDQKPTYKDSDGIFTDFMTVKLSERCGHPTHHQLCINQSKDATMAANKDERKDNGRNHTQKKPAHIAPLLKTVAKGTALFGILFLLHLRKRSDRNTNGKATEKSSEIHWKSSGVGLSTRKGEKGSKIYPVEKFKFGD